jgi:hypothetical protein
MLRLIGHQDVQAALGQDGQLPLFEVRDPLRAVRMPPDPFSLLDVALDGLRPCEETYTMAKSISKPVDSWVDERLLGALAVVPPNNMKAFKQRRGAILFADSFLGAAESDIANRRRGRPPAPGVRRGYQELDRLGARVFGIYDEQIDALVFTGAARPLNHERVALHEFGHAMTVREWHRTAHLRSDLLLGIPPQMEDLLKAYKQGNSREAISERVLEVLAEAYVWMIVGRWEELPGRLRNIIQDVVARGGAARVLV